MGSLQSIDLAVVVAYLVGVVGCGTWFARGCRNTDDFMAASRTLPGWAIGLSMFGSYVSSISFLANPGKAYAGNWNPFVFSLATPIAAAIACGGLCRFTADWEKFPRTNISSAASGHGHEPMRLCASC